MANDRVRRVRRVRRACARRLSATWLIVGRFLFSVRESHVCPSHTWDDARHTWLTRFTARGALIDHARVIEPKRITRSKCRCRAAAAAFLFLTFALSDHFLPETEKEERSIDQLARLNREQWSTAIVNFASYTLLTLVDSPRRNSLAVLDQDIRRPSVI